MPPDFETSPQPRPLPIISEETRRRLLEDLTLDKPFEIAVYQEKRTPPTDALDNLAEGAIDELAAANPHLIQSLFEALSKTYSYPSGEVSRSKIDAATKGMAIVLKAYDIETGLKLLPNFSKLTAEDVQQTVIPTQQENMVPVGIVRTILERATLRKRIPEQHAALNEVINKSSGYCLNYSEVFKEGAVAMFKILGKVWPKVISPEQPLPPANTPNI